MVSPALDIEILADRYQDLLELTTPDGANGADDDPEQPQREEASDDLPF